MGDSRRFHFVEEPGIGYVCGIQWDHELGHTNVEIWPTIKSLKENHPYTDECGIVKVQISFVRRVKKTNL